MQAINRYQYKELNHILWDSKRDFINPEDAFKLYERRWSYIDQHKLTDKEKQLINLLTEQVGKGLFMPAL